MSIFCQSQGGAIFGKVFLDFNRNGIFEPDLGEMPFPHPVSIALHDFDPCDLGCDHRGSFCCQPELQNEDDYVRTLCGAQIITATPESAGDYSFLCADCFGSYYLQLHEDQVEESTSWKTSPVKIGSYRDGWTLSTNPNTTGIPRNNFDSNTGASDTFFMSSDLTTLQPNRQVIDLGIYIEDDAIISNSPTSNPTSQISLKYINNEALPIIVPTQLEPDEIFKRIFFDVRSLSFNQSIRLNSIRVHIGSKIPIGSNTRVKIFTKEGSHSGHETNKTAWKKLRTLPVINNGMAEYSVVNFKPDQLMQPLIVPANTTRALLLVHKKGIYSSVGTGLGNVCSQHNTYIDILEGTTSKNWKKKSLNAINRKSLVVLWNGALEIIEDSDGMNRE